VPRGKPAKKEKGTGPKAAALKPVTAKEYGVIRGKVAWTGDPPANLEALTTGLRQGMGANKDKDYCLSGKDFETTQQVYRIGENKGLGNVFVWIVPEEGHYFQIPGDQLEKFKGEVHIHQPHCAFLPHSTVLFPSTYDKDGKPKKTGQVLVIENDAKVSHNSKVAGTINQPGDKIMTPGANERFTLKPEKNYLTVSCGVHAWMKGYIRVFDHPYAAVTSVGADPKAKKWEDTASDKFGTYEITGVPVGAKVRIIAWHEDLGFLGEGDRGKELEIKKENTENFEAKAK
jgi:hypothetical protein